MENRFGIKDFFIFLALIVLIVLVVVAMFQYDRQWEDVQLVKTRLESQSVEIQKLSRLIENGAVTMRGSDAAADAAGVQKSDGPFSRILKAQSLAGYASGDWFISSFPGKTAKLTPLLSGDAYAAEVQSHVLESLVSRDPQTLDWYGLLAKSWTIHDNSQAWHEAMDPLRQRVKGDPKKFFDDPDLPSEFATLPQVKELKQALDKGEAVEVPDSVLALYPGIPDAATIRFTLRDGVRFSDGQPLTADDVIFTYDLIMNPAIAAPRARAYYSRIRAVQKTGGDEVEFVFCEPYFQAFELAATMEILPQHFYSKYTPEQLNQSVGLLMGSGPYRLPDPASWKPGAPIELVRNDRYWGVPPAFNRIVFREISSDQGRLASFRNGEIDALSASPDQYRALSSDPQFMQKVQAFEYQNPVGGYRYVAWNERNPLFKDRRVRQALTMLLDRQRMIQEISLGYGALATGPFNPLSKQYNPQVKPWPYDVAEAKKLFTEAGFSDNGDNGILKDADGRPFEFRLTYPAGSANYDKMVLYMRDAYAQAGIILKPDPLEWQAFEDRLKNKNFEAISLGWTSGLESDIYQMFDSSQSGPEGDNFISYANPKLDEIIEKARSTMDEAQRMPLWQQAHEILHEDQPYTFLWFGKSLIFVDKRIQNIQRVKLGLSPMDEWFVPLSEQKYSQ